MITLTVNGKQQTLDVEDDAPLLWVLRDELGLTGTKFGCGIAQCGACTVQIDGVAQRTCILPVSRAAKSDHPVQVAWQAEDVPQCGYCQSGQIMAAAAFLKTHPQPTDADIDQGMTNLCRCGTYPRIKKAIHRAAKLASGVKA
jgi:isoquinoline 1-oxidoreductase alpha subunit